MEWISVKDRLPDHDDEVLIFASGDIVQAYLKNGKWNGSMLVTSNMDDGYVHDRTICIQGGDFDFVTHWMELPPPPQH